MRIISRIEEGERWDSAFIGYKVVEYKDFSRVSIKVVRGLRLSINLVFILIKMEFIPKR